MLNKTLQFLLFCLITFIGTAQNSNVDLQLIQEKQILNVKDFSYYKREGNDKKVIKNHNHSFLSKINPINNTLKVAMLLYQNIISPQLSKSCAYQITCSNYSKQAIAKYGIIKGVFLSADRLMRCNRISVLDVNTLDIDETTGTIIDTL